MVKSDKNAKKIQRREVRYLGRIYG